MTFDITKCRKDENGHLIARTSDKYEIRLCCVNAPGRYPLVGWWDGNPHVLLRWTADGQEIYNKPPSPNDLVNEPVTHTVTVFRYILDGMWRYDVGYGDQTWPHYRPDFKPGPRDSRKVITITEGEGL